MIGLASIGIVDYMWVPHKWVFVVGKNANYCLMGTIKETGGGVGCNVTMEPIHGMTGVCTQH